MKDNAITMLMLSRFFRSRLSLSELFLSSECSFFASQAVIEIPFAILPAICIARQCI